MASSTGRYMIAFNGEIYNHLALRRDLEAARVLQRPWRGHSDTETLLAAIEAWGLETTLQRITGLFAIALGIAASAGCSWLATDSEKSLSITDSWELEPIEP